MQKVMTPSPASGIAPASASWSSWRKSKVPVSLQSSTMPISMPTSPALVIQKALTAALAASGLVYQ